MLTLALILAFPIEFEAASGLFENAFYHVLCLADQISCSRHQIESHWHQTLMWNEEDEQRLDAVKSVLNDISESSEDPIPIKFMANYRSYYPSIRDQDRLLQKILESGNSDRIPLAVSGVVSSQDASQIAAAFKHFQDRMRPWWEANRRGETATYEHELVMNLQSENLLALPISVARLMQINLSRVGLHVVRSTNRSGVASSATVMGRHIFIEAGPRDTAIDGVWKTLHELVHLSYDNATMDVHRDLIDQFLKTKRSNAVNYYTILNEVLATALQLIVYEYLQIDESGGDAVYNDFFVRESAFAIRPILKEWVEHESELHSGFVTRYIDAIDARIGEKTLRPQFILNSTFLIGREKHSEAFELFRDLVSPIALSDEESDSFSRVNITRLMTYEEIDSQPGLLPKDIDLQAHSGLVYSPIPVSQRRTYLIAAKDEAALNNVIKRFAELDDVTGVGLLVAID